MQEVDAGGGCRRWMYEVDARGGCKRWMQEVDAGGRCRGWIQWGAHGGGQGFRSSQKFRLGPQVAAGGGGHTGGDRVTEVYRNFGWDPREEGRSHGRKSRTFTKG